MARALLSWHLSRLPESQRDNVKQQVAHTTGRKRATEIYTFVIAGLYRADKSDPDNNVALARQLLDATFHRVQGFSMYFYANTLLLRG